MTDPIYHKIVDFEHLQRFKSKQDEYNEATYLTSESTAAAADRLSNEEAVGDAERPVYFSADGVPVAADHTVQADVPPDAVFTDTTYGAATSSEDGLMPASDKAKLDGVQAGAEANQNAFSSVTVGQSTVAARQESDDLVLVAGANVRLAASNGAVTISADDTTYSDVEPDETGTAASGLMSSADKYKLDNFQPGGEVNVLEGVAVNGSDLPIDANKKVSFSFASGDALGGLGSIRLNGTAYTAYGLGTAAAANVAPSIGDGESGLVSGGQVHDYVAAALSSTYKPAGSLGPSGVVAALLVSANLGNVYSLTGDLTLDAQLAALFVDAEVGEVIDEGTNIAVVQVDENIYKFDSMAGFVDLSGYVPFTDVTIATDGDIDALFA